VFALSEHKEHTSMKPKTTICLWFDKDAHEAARFYAATFPDSEVTAVHEAPADYPGGKAGDVLTVEFTVLGIPCLGLNGGPVFKHSEAFSFQIATDNQEETDRYWNAIVGNGGNESACGWCKDRWGLSWQITPRALMDALAAGAGEAKTCLRGDDGNEKNRRRQDRGSPPWMTMTWMPPGYAIRGRVAHSKPALSLPKGPLLA
jgi:predicted 3-demethylubiquinone-9 3-methyltransferase (glyoxalase superfamily)